MLSREERIFSELLLARGLVARDFIEGYARKNADDDSEPSLAEFLIDSGGLPKAQADEVLEEARAIDATLAPHLAGGTRLGEFRLIRELGRGGMGIVYEAEQESLGRRVALKVLPAGAALDERLAIRFLREARAAGRLQHPGIVPVFASGRAEGVLFFAMELIEGRSLAEIVKDGPMAPDRAARVTAEIARALDHAHDAELVHRDVKPENILVAEDGRARLTDFGLVHESVASSFTLPHHVLGTPAYMAPEQALGNAVDRRCDIYALGAVLYTLLCSKPPYGGALPSIVLSRVLTGSPPSLLSLNEGVPRSVVAICDRAMARKPEDRYATAAELAEDLEAFLRGEALARVVSPKRSRRVGIRWTLGLVSIAATGALIAAISMRGGTVAPAAVALRPDPTFVLVNSTVGAKSLPSLSPDGQRLAYTSSSDDPRVEGYVEDLATHEVFNLPALAYNPVFSPDGRSLAFGTTGGVSLMELDRRTVRHLGGPSPRGFGLAWSPDGKEIISTGPGGSGAESAIGRIWSVDVGSGHVRVVRSLDARTPSYSPHGLRIAFASRAGGPMDVWTVPPVGGDAIRLTSDPAVDWNPFWSPDGRRIYFGSDRGGAPRLWSVGVDEASGRPIGSPEPALNVSFPGMFFATLSADGTRMALVSDENQGTIFRLPFNPATGTLTSSPVRLPRDLGAMMAAQPSPDGKFLVYTALSPDEDVAIVAADGASGRRFVTNDDFDDRAPRWSPSGERIAFHSNRSGGMEIFTVRPDGSDLRQLTKTPNGKAAFPVWSPDGTRLAYSVEGVGPFVIAASGDSPPEALQAPAGGSAFQPWSFSPDGTTLAGSADGVVLYSIRDRTYRRLTDFGEKPVWLGDGRHLIFASGRSVFMVSSDGGKPREVYSAAPNGLLPSLSVSADGRSIYAGLTASPEEIWIADLPK